MLKLLALAVCVIGFVFLGPKALAEFRRAHPRNRASLSGHDEGKEAGDKPGSSAAA